MPGFGAAQGVGEGDDVCRGLLDDPVPADLQQAQDGCLPGPGRTGSRRLNRCRTMSSVREDDASGGSVDECRSR